MWALPLAGPGCLPGTPAAAHAAPPGAPLRPAGPRQPAAPPPASPAPQQPARLFWPRPALLRTTTTPCRRRAHQAHGPCATHQVLDDVGVVAGGQVLDLLLYLLQVLRVVLRQEGDDLDGHHLAARALQRLVHRAIRALACAGQGGRPGGRARWGAGLARGLGCAAGRPGQGAGGGARLRLRLTQDLLQLEALVQLLVRELCAWAWPGASAWQEPGPRAAPGGGC